MGNSPRRRYPTFEDALRDLDDPLCMIYLFANLPAQGRIQSDRTAVCKRLCREWELYCVRARALRRVFVSVKGTYFQAEVAGERVTWLVPHKFAQTLPNDIDFRVMLTFLEFYETLLKFVFFKLYADLGLRYPPRVDAEADAEAVHLDAVRLERAFSGASDASAAESKPHRREAQGPALSEDEKQRIASLKGKMGDIARRETEGPAGEEAGPAEGGRVALDEDSEGEEEEDGADGGDAEAMAALEEAVGDDQAAKDMLRQQREQREFRRLFKGAAFFINREVCAAEPLHRAAPRPFPPAPLPSTGADGLEWPGHSLQVPREMLEFIIRSFGGRVGWEGPGSPYAESDPCITHQVVDRPSVSQTHEGREYVQPQWVFDSINARMRLPTAKYRIGATLPVGGLRGPFPVGRAFLASALRPPPPSRTCPRSSTTTRRATSPATERSWIGSRASLRSDSQRTRCGRFGPQGDAWRALFPRPYSTVSAVPVYLFLLDRSTGRGRGGKRRRRRGGGGGRGRVPAGAGS